MDEMDTLMTMQAKLMSIPNVVQLLKDTKREVVYVTEMHGVKVKCKADAIKPTKYVADIKTMSDPVTEQNVMKAIRKYGYDQQGAFYTDICGVEKFYFICIEKKYPFSVGILELGEESYKAGKFKYLESLELYKYHFQQHPNKIDDYFIQGII
jgi:exodeoxyribonuclease VIII